MVSVVQLTIVSCIYTVFSPMELLVVVERMKATSPNSAFKLRSGVMALVAALDRQRAHFELNLKIEFAWPRDTCDCSKEIWTADRLCIIQAETAYLTSKFIPTGSTKL